MNHGIKTFLHPVKDVAAAKAIYTVLLGTEPFVDSPYYVGYQIGGVDFGLVPNGHDQGMVGPIGYWKVDDIEGTIASLVSAGATVAEEPKDVGGGRRTATLTDADGNTFGVLQDAE